MKIRRKRAGLHVMLGIIVVLILPSSGWTEEQWQTISSDLMNYTIQYPQEGWIAQLDYHQENMPEHVIIERAVLQNMQGAEIAIEVWNEAAAVTVSEWIDTHQMILPFTSKDTHKTIVSVRKVEALQYIYVYQSECGTRYDTIWTLFKENDHIFRISYVQSDAGASQAIYQHILETFEFVKLSPFAFARLAPGQTLGKQGSLVNADIQKVSSCGGYNDTCQCGANNPYPCCDNGGNCTWWAWHSACCNWGVGLPSAGNAKDWASNLSAHGYPVSSTPAPNTIGCNVDGTYGHVAWITRIVGNTVYFTDMDCCVGCKYGASEESASISYFNGGYSKPKSVVTFHTSSISQSQNNGNQ